MPTPTKKLTTASEPAQKPTQPTQKPTQPKTGFATAWEKSQFAKTQNSPSDPRSPNTNTQSTSGQANSSDDVFTRLKQVTDFFEPHRQKAEQAKIQKEERIETKVNRAADNQFNKQRILSQDTANSQRGLIGMQQSFQEKMFDKQQDAAKTKVFTVSSGNQPELNAQRQIRLQREAMDRQTHEAAIARNWQTAEASKERAARTAESAAAKVAASESQRRSTLMQIAGRPL